MIYFCLSKKNNLFYYESTKTLNKIKSLNKMKSLKKRNLSHPIYPLQDLLFYSSMLKSGPITWFQTQSESKVTTRTLIFMYRWTHQTCFLSVILTDRVKKFGHNIILPANFLILCGEAGASAYLQQSSQELIPIQQCFSFIHSK